MINSYLYFVTFTILLFLLIDDVASCNTDYENIKKGSVNLPVNKVIQDIPSVVSLRIDNKHFCSGAIVSNSHVVTSAYCVCYMSDDVKQNLRIVVGVSSSEERGTELLVEDIICHPSKRGNNAFYQLDLLNVALLKAKGGIPKGSKHSIARLPFPTEPATTVFSCFTYGWNTASKTIENVDKPLQALKISVIPGNLCSRSLKNYYNENFLIEHYKCGVKEQFSPLDLVDEKHTPQPYDWLDHGSPYYCDDILLGISHFPYVLTNWPITDNFLYTFSSLAPLYQFFKDSIPELTEVKT